MVQFKDEPPYESPEMRLARWRWVTREKKPWDGKMIYRFSEDCHIAPVDDDHILVVDDEVWLVEKVMGFVYDALLDPAHWKERTGTPGIHVMPNNDLWHHRDRYPRAPRPEN
jgi:hypothetical protein